MNIIIITNIRCVNWKEIPQKFNKNFFFVFWIQINQKNPIIMAKERWWRISPETKQKTMNEWMRCNNNEELNISNCQVFDNFFKMMIIIIRYNNKSQITLDGNIIIIIIIIKHCFVFKVTFTFTSYVHHLVMQNININNIDILIIQIGQQKMIIYGCFWQPEIVHYFSGKTNSFFDDDSWKSFFLSLSLSKIDKIFHHSLSPGLIDCGIFQLKSIKLIWY